MRNFKEAIGFGFKVTVVLIKQTKPIQKPNFK